MNIFLPKNAQHKLEQQKQAEMKQYQNRISDLSDELINWLTEKELSVSEFENVIDITRNRFQIYFGSKKIKELKDEEKE